LNFGTIELNNRNLRGQLDKRKEALIIDTKNVEGAQDMHLWLVGGKLLEVLQVNVVKT